MSNFNFNDNLYLGKRGDVPVGLPHDARLRHLYMIGQTGTGKSTLLLNLITQDLLNGYGIALLDPHGDLAEAVLQQVPSERGDHLVYFNPSDLEHPIGFNLLAQVPSDQRPLITDGVVSAFKHVWPDFWGPRLEHIFAHAVRSLMDVPGATLLALPRLLQDEVYRTSVVEQVRDPVVRAFWQYEFNSYSARFQNEAVAPILNKIGRVLMTPAIRNIISQPKSTIDLKFMIDNSRILICNLSKGKLGEGPSHLLGALLVTALAQAAFSRSDERKPFHLYVDEFQNFTTSGFSLILSEARKYGLSLTLAHQFLGQLPDHLREGVFGNVGSMISFRIGAEDVPALAHQFDLKRYEALKELANFAAWSSILKDGAPSEPFRLDTYRPPKIGNKHSERLVKNSRIRFGRDRSKVESRIEKFFNIDN